MLQMAKYWQIILPSGHTDLLVYQLEPMSLTNFTKQKPLERLKLLDNNSRIIFTQQMVYIKWQKHC